VEYIPPNNISADRIGPYNSKFARIAFENLQSVCASISQQGWPVVQYNQTALEQIVGREPPRDDEEEKADLSEDAKEGLGNQDKLH
jgi:hypothetical protein